MTLRDNLRRLAAQPTGYATATSAETREANKLVERGELHRVKVSRLRIVFFADKSDADRLAVTLTPSEGLRDELRRLATRPQGVMSTDASNPGAAADQLRRMPELFRLKVGPKEVRYFATQELLNGYAVTRSRTGLSFHKSVRPAPVAPASGEPIITATTKYTLCPTPEPRFKAIEPPLYAPRVYR